MKRRRAVGRRGVGLMVVVVGVVGRELEGARPGELGLGLQLERWTARLRQLPPFSRGILS